MTDERRVQITNDLAAIRPCLDERRAQITNDLAAIRSCLDEAEVLHDAGRTVGVNALLLMALRLVARLVAEAHGFDEFGEELERERQR